MAKRSRRSSGNPQRASASRPRPAAKAEPQRPRSALERFSAPLLLRLHGTPRWAFPLLTAALLLGGLLVPTPWLAALLLALLMLLLAWLVALSWPLLSPTARIMRLLVLGGLGMVAYGRASGRM